MDYIICLKYVKLDAVVVADPWEPVGKVPVILIVVEIGADDVVATGVTELQAKVSPGFADDYIT